MAFTVVASPAALALDPDEPLPPLPSPPAASAKAVVPDTKGHLGPVFGVCPVDPPRHYIDDFGDARWVGGFHRHQGIDIMAPRGTPIRAPFDGRLETSINWMGGIQLYVYGKLGFVFNGHLDRVEKGSGKVKAGDIVGYVGNSGDARGGSTHDHFEWHPGGGPAVDSFRLLNEACRGRPSRPAPELPRYTV
jgi:murein DD-endopeptidase MepM/ murein hydrolase activator NlpD